MLWPLKFWTINRGQSAYRRRCCRSARRLWSMSGSSLEIMCVSGVCGSLRTVTDVRPSRATQQNNQQARRQQHAMPFKTSLAASTPPPRLRRGRVTGLSLASHHACAATPSSRPVRWNSPISVWKPRLHRSLQLQVALRLLCGGSKTNGTGSWTLQDAWVVLCDYPFRQIFSLAPHMQHAPPVTAVSSRAYPGTSCIWLSDAWTWTCVLPFAIQLRAQSNLRSFWHCSYHSTTVTVGCR
jgi:hypothetical protein